MVVLFSVCGLLLASCTQSAQEYAAEQNERVQAANRLAEIQQERAREKRSGIRTDGQVVSGLGGGEVTTLCIDGEGDDSTEQGVIDIDSAKLYVEENALKVDVTLFPRNHGPTGLAGGLVLVSGGDSELWVSYASGPGFGRIGTDSSGNQDFGPMFVTLEGDLQLRFSVPLSDFAELGDLVGWTVRVDNTQSIRDLCPNDDREIYFSATELSGASGN